MLRATPCVVLPGRNANSAENTTTTTTTHQSTSNTTVPPCNCTQFPRHRVAMRSGSNRMFRHESKADLSQSRLTSVYPFFAPEARQSTIRPPLHPPPTADHPLTTPHHQQHYLRHHHRPTPPTRHPTSARSYLVEFDPRNGQAVLVLLDEGRPRRPQVEGEAVRRARPHPHREAVRVERHGGHLRVRNGVKGGPGVARCYSWSLGSIDRGVGLEKLEREFTRDI